jgi:zinc D-Ala-D-Ala carboxypeptidase
MQYPIKISNNITFKEATKSKQAISAGLTNFPNEAQLSNMIAVATKVFQPIREHFGVGIGISSFFRSPAVNKLVGGATNSSHMAGEAIDIDADIFEKQVIVDGKLVDLTNKMIFDYIVKNLDYDTIIWEFGDSDEPAWVHVSYSRTNNRKRKLRAHKDARGKTIYDFYS